MDRRFFLRLLGLAPFVPLAPKLPTLPSPATSGLMLAKLLAAKKLLDSNEPHGDYLYFNGFEFRRNQLSDSDRRTLLGSRIKQRVELPMDRWHMYQVITECGHWVRFDYVAVEDAENGVLRKIMHTSRRLMLEQVEKHGLA